MSPAPAPQKQDVIVNDTEFLSAHWLAEGFPARLSALVKDWREQAKEGHRDPLHALGSLSSDYLRELRSATDSTTSTLSAGSMSSADEAPLLTSAHRSLAHALGLAPNENTTHEGAVVETLQGSRPLTLPVIAARGLETSLDLVVLDAVGVDAVDLLLDGKVNKPGSGSLAQPMQLTNAQGREELVWSVARAVSEILASQASPHYVLVFAGRWVLLTDAARWSEGRYLALDLVTAMERRELTNSGGLARIAGLISAAVLLPDDAGENVMDKLTAESTTHAVGVSEELRVGLRRSIEIIANDVVRGLDEEELTDPDLPSQLATQSLRFLYRLLFLLYAEAHPELAVVPTASAEYQAGYGLDRLRDIALADLPDGAGESHHLHTSLDVLFRLVNGQAESVAELPVEDLRADLFDPGRTPLIDGYPDEIAQNTGEKRRWLSDTALHDVLRLLLLSNPSGKGRGGKRSRRGWISYANLGINQLGAVYEGLMSYTGVLTREPMVEVARGGDPSKGSWLVPERDSARYAESDIVRFTDPATGEERIRRYGAGQFAFRLSGRDRERSASYYTPEVLTQCVVRHSLAELLTEDTTAEEILSFRVCEPALGSGAFANEAVNQLADAYLERRQREMGERIEAEDLPSERRKVKAWIALHRVYGVDLNATAVELAEVSMWLNVMQPSMAAPWFGLHLKRGNSLIGARRAVYNLGEARAAKEKTWEVAPTERSLADVPPGNLPVGEVHHFLLPAKTWGAVADAKQAKELAPEEAATMKSWRKSMLRRPSATRPLIETIGADGETTRTRGPSEQHRLEALAARAESLWSIAAKRLKACEEAASRDLDVWHLPESLRPEPSTVTRREIEDSLGDPESMYQRLRLVMDAWCALSFWPLDKVDELPDWEEWLVFLEDTLGIASERKSKGSQKKYMPADTDVRLDDNPSFDELGVIEQFDIPEFSMQDSMTLVATHPLLTTVQAIAKREGFFHWELDFAQVFTAGGFDLQVGNPPWVRPVWKDDATLAEADPWFLLEEQIPEKAFESRRSVVLKNSRLLWRYLRDLSVSEATVSMLGSVVEHPVLAGLQTNLYANFIERSWRCMSGRGIVGLIHPEGHLTDLRAKRFRREVYSRLRRHWQFVNGDNLFEEVNSTEEFSVSIYSKPLSVEFLYVSDLRNPDVLERSLRCYRLQRDVPLDYLEPSWIEVPSASRVTVIREEDLASWSVLFGQRDIDVRSVRLVRATTVDFQEVLEVMSGNVSIIGGEGLLVSQCWHEKSAKQKGLIVREKTEAKTWSEVILQGPHIFVADPLYQNARRLGFVKSDYDGWDLERISDDVIPRTNYRRQCLRVDYDAAVDKWAGCPSWDYWRIAVRRMVRSFHVRTLKPALIPPGAAHVHAIHSCIASTCAAPVHAKFLKDPSRAGGFSRHPGGSLATVLVCGLWSSLPVDYLVKVSGKTDLHTEVLQMLPSTGSHPAWRYLLLRTLRLNCLTRAYEPLWRALAPLTDPEDTWTSAFADWPAIAVGHRDRAEAPVQPDDPEDRVEWEELGNLGLSPWTWETPLRSDFERRAALVETDALAAIMLGLTAEQLCLVYRAQFAVLRKYEHTMWFDSLGRQIAKHHQAFGVHQEKTDYPTLVDYVAAMEEIGINPQADQPSPEIAADVRFTDFLSRYEAPFTKADREREMTLAHAEFRRRLYAEGLTDAEGKELEA